MNNLAIMMFKQTSTADNSGSTILTVWPPNLINTCFKNPIVYFQKANVRFYLLWSMLRNKSASSNASELFISPLFFKYSKPRI